MEIYICICLFLIGAILASFYGVVATRLPRGKSIITPRSHCENCNHTLAWYELVPILSFLFLRGKCKECKKKLPLYEPLMELICGLLFMGAYLYYGISYSFFVSLLLISLFFLIYISDLKYMIILDSPLIITVISVFLLKWIYYGINTALWSIAEGLALFLFFLAIGFLGKRMFHREALGGGDIKFAFLMGMILGIPHAFMALVLSTFLALPYATFSLLRTEEKEVPYGPFLVSALCLVFFFYDKFSYILKLFYF